MEEIRHALYQIYGKDDHLLYVGVTKNPGQRFTAHSRLKPWWRDVVRIELDWFESRQAVLNAEYVWITFAHPEHNVIHRRDPFVLTPELEQMCREELSPEIFEAFMALRP